MAEDISGDTGGRYTEQTYQEKYPDMAEGRPEKGWDPNNYGYSDDFIIVPYGKHLDLLGLGLEVHDVISEDDNEVYYVMGAPKEQDPIPAQVPGHWWDPYTAVAKSWVVDVHSYDWGSLIPGLDFLKDTLDTAGKSVTLERKGRMLHAHFDMGLTSVDKYYEFPSVKELDSFLNKIGQDTGEDYYAGSNY